MKRVRLHISLDPSTIKYIEQEAKKENRSMSNMVEVLVLRAKEKR